MTNGELMANYKVRNTYTGPDIGQSLVIRHSDFVIKKVPPPAPDGREGRLFPPEQSGKLSVLVIEVDLGGNNNFAGSCRKSL